MDERVLPLSTSNFLNLFFSLGFFMLVASFPCAVRHVHVGLLHR
jgi:hypothetical protein